MKGKTLLGFGCGSGVVATAATLAGQIRSFTSDVLYDWDNRVLVAHFREVAEEVAIADWQVKEGAG